MCAMNDAHGGRRSVKETTMLFTPIRHRSAYVSVPRAFDTHLERWLNGTLENTSHCTKPALQQDEQAYTLSFDLPGVTKEQLTIGIEGAVVRIETVADAPRRYQMAYELPQELDASASSAKLELGVLTLKLAKLVPPTKASTLTVQ